jgi:hypothetical protein
MRHSVTHCVWLARVTMTGNLYFQSRPLCGGHLTLLCTSYLGTTCESWVGFETNAVATQLGHDRKYLKINASSMYTCKFWNI